MRTRVRRFHLALLLLLVPAHASAREGGFVRFALGPGAAVETSALHRTAPALAVKDHAIGYGFTDCFAVHLADFGALVRARVGTHDYVNLDALGPGITWSEPSGIQASFVAGYGAVTLAHRWSEATGTNRAEGVAFGAGLRKEWAVTKRVALGVGAHACAFRTSRESYRFFVVGLEGTLGLYATPRSHSGSDVRRRVRSS